MKDDTGCAYARYESFSSYEGVGYIACGSHPFMAICFRYHAASFVLRNITPEDGAYKGRVSIGFNPQGDWLSVHLGEYLGCDGSIWLERDVLHFF